MAMQVTPSTGATRTVADVDYNRARKIAPGDVILYIRMGVWCADEVQSVAHSHVIVDPAVVPYNAIAGVVPPSIGRGRLLAAHLENVRALAKRGDDGIETARKAKRDSLQAYIDSMYLTKEGPLPEA